MSTRRKHPTGSPIPRAPHLYGRSLADLASECGGDRQQALRVLHGAVKRGEIVRIQSAARVIWAEMPREVNGRTALLGVSAGAYAVGAGIDVDEAGRVLAEARDRGEVAQIRTMGRDVWARLGDGQITEVPAATGDRHEREEER